MSVRFFFDLVCENEIIRDSEGVEAKDLEQALSEARSIVAEMVDDVNEINSGRFWSLIVRDETGSTVGCIEIK